MNAIALLEKQHAETLEALEQLEKSSPGPTRKNVFKDLQKSLLAHMVIEEEIFYPAVAAAQKDGDPIAEGYEEHSGARVALERCGRALAEKVLFGIRIGVLTEMIKHHIGEERGDIFPLAKKALGDQLVTLGEEMELRFEKAKRESPTARLDRMSTARAKEALS